ncbi:taste receptor type 1 member 2 [Paroedura picta]|uniref:taste receptor type 1 member 2 n=1 Tax=Paroedura picta TaxID=143630 RepID=UPI00405764CF
MRFAVEEINNSSALLPGISLGYEMMDVCYLTNIIHPVLYFLSDHHSQLEIQTNYTHYRPRVVAVIGPDSSLAAVPVAHLLSLFLVPQITYSATSQALSDPRLFPVAFRTIPSMEQQISVMVLLLQEFQWDWVVVLSSEDGYGQQSLHMLRAQAAWLCIALHETIPVPRDSREEGRAQQRREAAVRQMGQSTARVVLVLSLELPLPAFFQEVLRQNLTGRVWIASEAWALDPSVYGIAGLSGIGTVFGVAAQDVPMPGFADFRVRLPSSPTGEGAGAQGAAGACNQVCDRCFPQMLLRHQVLRDSGDRIDFNVYSAVHVVARALHRLLGCGRPEGCRKQHVFPWQLLEEVGRVQFSLLNTPISFDEKGDPPAGFEVIQWQWDVPGRPFKPMATYDALRGELHVSTEAITWHTPNNTPPRSICSEQCERGHKKKLIGSVSCCFECVPCQAGTFLNKSNPFVCQRCPRDMWSGPGQGRCFKRLVKYLAWGDLSALLLLVGAALGLSAALGVLALFLRYSDTPVVKSAGGRLCFLMLATLSAGFLIVPFYVGRPTGAKCVCRQAVFSLCFTLCVACMTVRSFQIVCAFRMAARLPVAHGLWQKYHGQWVFMGTAFAAKLLIVGATAYTHPPGPVELALSSDPAVVNLMCDASYKSSRMVPSALDMALSSLCFCLAYMGKALPKNYNEAKYISLCMIGYFTSWVALFLVTSLHEGVGVTVFDAATMLSHLLGFLASYFGPKCYVILLQPERNTAAFFQTAIQSYTMRHA